eukprot:575256-Rhodomonas_salina.1
MLRLGALIDFDWYSLPSPQFPFIPASLILFMQERGSDGCRWAVAAASPDLMYWQHLESNKIVDELQDNFVLAVTTIKTLQMENYVHIDAQTLHSLQILHVDRHPSLYSKGKDKEGLSLFRSSPRHLNSFITGRRAVTLAADIAPLDSVEVTAACWTTPRAQLGAAC